MTRNLMTAAFMALILSAVSALGQEAEIHPKKEAFRDAAQWTRTVPGDVKLKHFRPFRAVYDRHYRQASGPRAGEPRQDRVILSAEKVGWDGREAIALTMIDSGEARWDDTNARVLAMFVDADDLSLLFELGPIPGKAKDYYIGRGVDDNMVATFITTSDGKAQPQVIPTGGAAGFGPAAWVAANMQLEAGKQILVDQVFSPKGNPLTWWRTGKIRGQETFRSGSGKEYQAWVMESFWSLKDSRAVLVYLTPEPPYYLGTLYEDLETGQRKEFLRIREFSYLER